MPAHARSCISRALRVLLSGTGLDVSEVLPRAPENDENFPHPPKFANSQLRNHTSSKPADVCAHTALRAPLTRYAQPQSTPSGGGDREVTNSLGEAKNALF